MRAYTHASLASWRRLVPCASAALCASRLAHRRRLAPRRRSVPCALAACASAALRASPLGSASNPLVTPFALHLDGALRLVPRRCLAICGLAAPRASPLGSAPHLAPRRRFAPCVSAALARPAFSRFRRPLLKVGEKSAMVKEATLGKHAGLIMEVETIEEGVFFALSKT